MYRVYIDYDDKDGTFCYKTDRDGKETKIRPNESVQIDDISQLTCMTNDLINNGFVNEGNKVRDLYDDITISPIFDSYINYSDISGPHTISIQFGEIPYDLLSAYIDLNLYDLKNSELMNTVTGEIIPLNEPLTTSGIYSLKLSPFITFLIDDKDLRIMSFANTSAKEYKISSTELINSKPPAINIDDAYTFNGWISDSGNYDSIDFATLTKPITFTPIIQEKYYTVKFNGCNNDVTLSVPYNTIITKTSYPEFKNISCNKEGYTFNGWSEEKFTNHVNSNSIWYYILCIISIIIIAYILIIVHKFSSKIRITKSGYSQTRE